MKTKISAVVAASGIGARTGLDVPKQFYEINKIPVLAYTLRALCRIKQICEIIVAVPDEYVLYTNDFIKKLGFDKKIKIICGGKTRQESVYACLKETDEQSGFVIIHDGARPFVKKNDILNCISDAEKHGAAALGARCSDTLKKSDGGFIERTVDRDEIYRIFTPQIFERDLILKLHKSAAENSVSVTDDCALAEKAGIRVKITECEGINLKITVREDILFAEAVLKWEWE